MPEDHPNPARGSGAHHRSAGPRPTSATAAGGRRREGGPTGAARGAGRRRRGAGREPGRERVAEHRRRRAQAAGALRVRYPEELPVTQARAEIAAALRDHQVVIVAGETGSGKTTQLPKICLELGRGVAGQIGHTQPRRIAARSVAERLAEELEVEVGEQVGYQVRFTDYSRPDTLIKVMTDGVLLNELQRDRDLRRYDTIIIDEAHERSLNIDFLLGYLHQLLPRRPDLKVIITSATIEPEKFAAHFAQHGRPAPIIEVSGRTYPVTVHYRPLVRETTPKTPGGPVGQVEIDQVTGICEAVEELWTQAGGGDGLGQDILVFCSGEREIRDAAEALAGLGLPDTQILPLFARLSAAEQHRVFQRHSGRRVVLATNVAETSLTVPGIRYVVDTGTARISRYSQRTKVQRLPIEPISQASANQRSGRCGRLADGTAIRLYSPEDYEARPAFTDPEILRTHLASVILAMMNLGLGDLARFPFVDPPDARMITDGIRLLHELGAIDPKAEDPRRRLTPIGRRLARLPVDPRLARMLLEADAHGVLAEVIVIVAALSIQDVRERPAESSARADELHARFRDANSDFVTLLNLWWYVRGRQRALSGSAFRRLCREEFLHYLRIREWQDLVGQLRSACSEIGLTAQFARSPGDSDGEPTTRVRDRAQDRAQERGRDGGRTVAGDREGGRARGRVRAGDRRSGQGEIAALVPVADGDAIHASLLPGLLSHIGVRDEQRRDYLGARGAHFLIQRGSTLHGRAPEWIMAAELVETSRMWARVIARTDPASVERAASHLVKRQYSEPVWSRSRAGVVATERVTLYGIPLVTDRRVSFAAIDPELCRDLFIRHGLVEGDWQTPHRFFHDNRKLVRRLAELESKARRRDIIVDDETLVAFYDERIPEQVVSGAHFDSWWKKARRDDPDLLTFTEELVLNEEAAAAIDAGDYPHVWEQGDLRLRLTYQFEPGADADGVTCHIPLEQLNQVRETGFDWLVPGLREDLATALVRSLPKATRRLFVPAPDRARAALAHADPEAGRLVDELARGLYIVTGHRVPEGQWNVDLVPDHLRMTFRVEGSPGASSAGGGRSDGGRGRGRRRGAGGVSVLAEGKDLAALQEELAGSVRTTMARAAADLGLERAELTDWDFPDLPDTFQRKHGGRTVQGFPALVDEGSTVAVRVLATAQEQEQATRAGLRRLLLLNTSVPWPKVLRLLSNQARLTLGHNPHGSVPALLDDVLAAAVDAIVAGAAGKSSVAGAAHAPSGALAVRSRAEYEAVHAAVQRQVVPTVLEIVEMLHPILDKALRVRLAVDGLSSAAAAPLREDVDARLRALVYPGFVADTGLPQLRHLQRYLSALLERLDKGPQDMRRDAERREQLAVVSAEYAQLVADLPALERNAADVVALRWMIEEFAVSLFAQRLGTAHPVSAQRIYAAMDAVEAGHRRD